MVPCIFHPTTPKECNKKIFICFHWWEKSQKCAHTLLPQPMSYRKYANILQEKSFLEMEVVQKSTGYRNNSCSENCPGCLGKKRHCRWTTDMDRTWDSCWTQHFHWSWWAHRGLLPLWTTAFWAVGWSQDTHKKSVYLHCKMKTSYAWLSHWFLLDKRKKTK